MSCGGTRQLRAHRSGRVAGTPPHRWRDCQRRARAAPRGRRTVSGSHPCQWTNRIAPAARRCGEEARTGALAAARRCGPIVWGALPPPAPPTPRNGLWAMAMTPRRGEVVVLVGVAGWCRGGGRRSAQSGRRHRTRPPRVCRPPVAAAAPTAAATVTGAGAARGGRAGCASPAHGRDAQTGGGGAPHIPDPCSPRPHRQLRRRDETAGVAAAAAVVPRRARRRRPPPVSGGWRSRGSRSPDGRAGRRVVTSPRALEARSPYPPAAGRPAVGFTSTP